MGGALAAAKFTEMKVQAVRQPRHVDDFAVGLAECALGEAEALMSQPDGDQCGDDGEDAEVEAEDHRGEICLTEPEELTDECAVFDKRLVGENLVHLWIEDGGEEVVVVRWRQLWPETRGCFLTGGLRGAVACAACTLSKSAST